MVSRPPLPDEVRQGDFLPRDVAASRAPGESKTQETRYLDIYEDDQIDEERLAAWIKQAASIPGWDGGSSRLYGGIPL